MESKVIAVPQEEFFQVIDMMEEYKDVCVHFIGDELEDRRPLFTDLCEFYAACERIKERILKMMQKEVDSKGAVVPENSIVVDDLDYLMVTELLIGLSQLERIILDQNVSLKKH